MKRMMVAAAIALAGSSCSSTVDTPGETLPSLTEEHGCGFGFFVGNADQTVGLFVQYQDYEGARADQVPATSQLTEEVWNAELRFGSDLFANWCDDVLEAGEPTPEVEATWDVSGTVRITQMSDQVGCGLGSATATLEEVTGHGPDGQVMVLGDFDVQNEHWGCIPG